MALPIDPSFAVTGPEWSMPAVEGASETAAAPEGGGFGSALSEAIGSLSRSQEDAAGAARALATGEASDPTSVVMAVERARLSMQMASQIRNKAVEAVQDIFHTQV